MEQMNVCPHLVLNDPCKPRRVLSTLQSELRSCLSFQFYVAFVNQHGVASLLQALTETRDRKVLGKILVSTYLNFTDLIALRSLLKFENIDLRIMTQGNMHAKGYFFSQTGIERYVIGSSNWTASALSQNTELNVLLQTEPDSPLAKEISGEFERHFELSTKVTESFIAEQDIQRYANKEPQTKELTAATEHWGEIKPNQMQEEALKALAALRVQGKSKAILVSATGTGKTYLAAFDAKAFAAKTLLFVVHRETIAKEALQAFQRIIGNNATYGMYTGSAHDANADYIFSTVQTLSRPERLKAFSPDQFDYIIVDESHRAGAASYQRFLEYFRPRFLLGMTATPERTDGADIFHYYDYNIAYEIRLQQALEEDMLCPFHYFGITDLTVNGEVIDEHSDFKKLACDERADRIVQAAHHYGCDDGVVRGLIFCSRTREAEQLSVLLEQRGIRTLALTGTAEQSDREEAMRRLETSEDDPEKLDYIITVDIFNEGVDIPQVNQIIMLRPTQSAIIFVQQLGRGLRKVKGKDKYLTVIDFIGNYQNNYLIPAAIYGDRSFDKDQLRRLLVSGNADMPGTSTINFDLISQKRIFESINQAKLLKIHDLQDAYNAVRSRLGRAPMMMDFVTHQARDPSAFSEYSNSFYSFSRRSETVAPVPAIQPNALKVLEVYSKYILNGKRPEEARIILDILNQGFTTINRVAETLTMPLPPNQRAKGTESALHCLNLRFTRERDGHKSKTVREIIGFDVIKERNGDLIWSRSFEQLLDPTMHSYLRDLAEYSMHTFLCRFDPQLYNLGFIRGQKYTRADVFRLLHWKVNPIPLSVGGYIISSDQSNCPIFVTYDKDEKVAATMQYKDQFLSPNRMQWYTKSKRTLRSPEVKHFQQLTSDQRMPLFVKKNDDEGQSFYYLGDVRPEEGSFVQDHISDGKGSNVSVVKLLLKLDEPVNESLYKYITE